MIIGGRFMDWENYEKTVEYIYTKLGKKYEIDIICTGRNCTCTGKSGAKHQLDVFFKLSDGINDYKTYVECKYRKNNINKDHVMKVSTIVEDCNLNKGVIVSKKGFTPQAILVAEAKNIELQILREPIEEDKKNRLWEIDGTVHLMRPTVYVDLIVDKGSVNDKMESVLKDLEIGYNDSILLANGSKVVISELPVIKNSAMGEKFEINCPKGSFLLFDNLPDEVELKGLIIQTVNEKEKVGEFHLNADDKIKMIMQDISGEKNIILTKDGDVQDKSKR